MNFFALIVSVSKLNCAYLQYDLKIIKAIFRSIHFSLANIPDIDEKIIILEIEH